MNSNKRQHPIAVIVHGQPATGKTTLAEHLAGDLSLPLFTKDSIKVAIFDALGWRDREWSSRVGAAAYKLLDGLMETQLKAGASFIVEANFKPEQDRAKFERLHHQYDVTFVQVLMSAAASVIEQRFAERAAADSRHPSHTEGQAGLENLAAILARPYAALDIPGLVIAVDTTDFANVDYARLTAQVRKHLEP